MKWFRHESRAHLDAKLQKLVMKYGFEGYGLYWYCVENICANLEPKLTFELEVDSEILSHIGRIDSRKVEEMMLYMVNVGLFQQKDYLFTCLNLARYLGEKSTRNPQLIEIIKTSKTVPDSPRQSGKVQESPPEIRGDKKRLEKHRGGRFTPPTVEEVQAVIDEKGYHFSAEGFVAYYESQDWRKANGQKITRWKACCVTFEERWKRDNPQQEAPNEHYF